MQYYFIQGASAISLSLVDREDANVIESLIHEQEEDKSIARLCETNTWSIER